MKTWDEWSADLDDLMAARLAAKRAGDQERVARICEEAQAVIADMRVRWAELCAPPGR